MAADSRLLNNPYMLPDMAKAVTRLRQAIDRREIIGVFGDFDTDGLTGTALLVQALQEVENPVTWYLPHREKEGHGLNPTAIDILDTRGVQLIVTVDCGAGSQKEIALASSRGIDTIVTDHHSPSSELPEAVALIDPNLGNQSYPFNGLTGVGLAFKLVEAVWSDLALPYPGHLLDLVALGTVADVGQMTSENRYFVKQGLMRMNLTSRPGLEALINQSNLNRGTIDSEALAFKLIPRLNAAGRLGDASVSLQLLTAPDYETAVPLAERLEEQNSERRRLSDTAMTEALTQVDVGGIVPPIIIVKRRGWKPGILGLIAARMVDTFHRPSIAISIGPNVSRASARSVVGFDITHTLHQVESLLNQFGGHPQAAGFTVATSGLVELERKLLVAAQSQIRKVRLTTEVEIDCEISPTLLNKPIMDFLSSLAPFGPGNPEPVFLTRNTRVVDVKRVGKGGAHLKIRTTHGRGTWTAIAFHKGHLDINVGDLVDLIYSVRVNEWGGSRRVELMVLNLVSNSQ